MWVVVVVVVIEMFVDVVVEGLVVIMCGVIVVVF